MQGGLVITTKDEETVQALINWYDTNTTQKAKKSIQVDDNFNIYILQNIGKAFARDYEMIIAYKLMEYNYKLISVLKGNSLPTYYYSNQYD